MARRVEVLEELLREARSVPPVARRVSGGPPDGPRDVAEAVRFALDHPRAIHRLHLATGGLRHQSSLEHALPVLLDRGMWLLGSDLGVVHVVDGATGALRLVAHAGFDDDFVDRYAVLADGLTDFARLAEDGQAVTADVDAEPSFAPYRPVASRYGFRAVQATPLRDYAGRTVGLLSTHWQRPCRPPRADLQAFVLYATYAGELVAALLAGEKAGAVDADAPPGVSRPAHATRAGPFAKALRADDGVTSLADLVVTSVFSAELELDAARSLTDEGPVAARIAAATGTLERLVVQLRAAMLDGGLSEEDEGPAAR